MELSQLQTKFNDLKCQLRIHSWNKNWSKREKFKGAFDSVMFIQFKKCTNCGAEKQREV